MGEKKKCNWLPMQGKVLRNAEGGPGRVGSGLDGLHLQILFNYTNLACVVIIVRAGLTLSL